MINGISIRMEPMEGHGNRAEIHWEHGESAYDFVERFMGVMVAIGFHPDSVTDAMELACEQSKGDL